MLKVEIEKNRKQTMEILRKKNAMFSGVCVFNMNIESNVCNKYVVQSIQLVDTIIVCEYFYAHRD